MGNILTGEDMRLRKGERQREGALAQRLPVLILKYLRGNFENLILAYSGGTDSTLLLLLCHHYGIRPDRVVFNNTGLELGENIAYVHLVAKEILSLPIYPRDIYVELRPEMKPRDLARMILEEFYQTQDKPYDKHDYRCCWHAKEKPMVDWLRREGLDRDSTCVVRGIRAAESSQRMMSSIRLISAGHLYHHDFRHAREAQVSDPLILTTETVKEGYLERLCKASGLPRPQPSGCAICPIYYRFARPEERETPQFRVASRFFERHAKNLITSWA